MHSHSSRAKSAIARKNTNEPCKFLHVSGSLVKWSLFFGKNSIQWFASSTY